MQSKKKKLGQFFTEPTIAKFMVKLVLKNDSHDVLDPAVGMGAFTEILSGRYRRCDLLRPLCCLRDAGKRAKEYPYCSVLDACPAPFLLCV